MEMLEAVHLNTNHAHDSAPAQAPAPAAVTLDALMAKREQLIQGLSGARAQLETQAQSVARTEGALMYVNQLIIELDPDAFNHAQIPAMTAGNLAATTQRQGG